MPLVTSRMAGRLRDRTAVPPLFLRQFQDRRRRVLILRQSGGLGDILMHRMLFEDFKLLMPDCHLVFACPRVYWPAVEDHPFIDELADSAAVNVRDYLVHYCTTTACGRHELRVAPLSDKHRSDIWAEHCGVRLTRHDMHVRLTDAERAFGRAELGRANPSGRPTVVVCPISAMEGKNLDAGQVAATVRGVAEMGGFPVGLHSAPIPGLGDAPLLTGYSTRQWMGVLAGADYVVSADTAAFHFAGGVGRPLTGVFSWADGRVYGRYYQFELVQKHRADDPGWCGPCYNWSRCPKGDPLAVRKPCITEITPDHILAGVRRMFDRWPLAAPRRVVLTA
jgi:ADP-heptose:LPS heptosyltransferase